MSRRRSLPPGPARARAALVAALALAPVTRVSAAAGAPQESGAVALPAPQPPAPQPPAPAVAPAGREAVAPLRRQIELPAAVLERYTGYYALGDSGVITVTLAGTQLSAQLTGQPAAEIYPESAAAFFYRVVDAQIDFIPDPPAQIDALVLHQNGRDLMAQRIDAAQAQSIASAVAARVQGQAAAPGSEAAVRRLLAGIEAGTPNYGEMSPELAAATRAQLPKLQPALAALGAVRSVQFQGVGNQGWDVYFVQHEHGSSQVRMQLSGDGRITGALISIGP